MMIHTRKLFASIFKNNNHLRRFSSITPKTELNNHHSSLDPTSSFKLDDELFKLDVLREPVVQQTEKVNAARIGKGFCFCFCYFFFFFFFFRSLF
jgi:hypothetical protein